jgi:hypothetical protein
VIRTVTLVLLDRAGQLLGELEPFELSLPWWQEASDVVEAARQRFALDLAVLRLLDAERPHPPGGAVRYLAQLFRAKPLHEGSSAVHPAAAERLPALRPVSEERRRRALEPQPLRAAWAKPGGPEQSIAWVRARLAELGLGELGVASQQRAWNLSTIWRITSGPRGEHVSWLKQLPAFFAHETAVLRWLGRDLPGVAPSLLAADGFGRQLLANAPGSDRYDAAAREREGFAKLLHVVQQRAAQAADGLVRAGVPDRRGARLGRFIRHWLDMSGVDRTPAAAVLDTLDARLSALADCGLDDTLVHGDFHPGNVRCDGEHATLLDWGDASVGHPGFDILRLCDGCSASDAAALVHAWCERWRADCPGSDPERAVRLLRPLAALCGAAVFASFVAQIEPSEHPFHAADVPAQLERAAALDVA